MKNNNKPYDHVWNPWLVRKPIYKDKDRLDFLDNFIKQYGAIGLAESQENLRGPSLTAAGLNWTVRKQIDYCIALEPYVNASAEIKDQTPYIDKNGPSPPTHNDKQRIDFLQSFIEKHGGIMLNNGTSEDYELKGLITLTCNCGHTSTLREAIDFSLTVGLSKEWSTVKGKS
jgi:hypothetical protein